MPHPARLARAVSALLVPLLLAACGSTGGSSPSPSNSSASPEPAATAPESGAQSPARAGKGIKVGWMDYRPAKKVGQVQTLTLLGAATEEGRLIQKGRARMEGGKVVDDETASLLERSFQEAGFDRYAVKRSPKEPTPGALQVVWIDRGNGFESLYLVPGARQNPDTRSLPDVFDALKKLIFSVHQSSPGSMVLTGEGWSGDTLTNQKPGNTNR